MYIAHRDRLCRFAYELVEWILKKHCVRVVVVDSDQTSSSGINNPQDVQRELADDLLAITVTFSTKSVMKTNYSTTRCTALLQNLYQPSTATCALCVRASTSTSCASQLALTRRAKTKPHRPTTTRRLHWILVRHFPTELAIAPFDTDIDILHGRCEDV